MRPVIFVLFVCGLAGCVSQGGDAQADAQQASTPGPVDVAQDRLRRHVDRLSHLYGQRLLGTIQEIIAHKELALEPVIEALPGAQARTQANLVYILGYLGGEEAHDAVLPYLGAEDPAVRFEAAAALLNMGDWGGVPVLLACMESENRRERYKAAEALKELVKKDFGYHFDAAPSEREQAIGRWRSWWDGQRETLIYGPGDKVPALRPAGSREDS